jgi:Protein of unknown function (DUF1580)
MTDRSIDFLKASRQDASDLRPKADSPLQQLLDGALPLADAARLLPGRPHPSTVWRWRKKGVRGIKLETLQIGGRVWVTRSAIADFLTALSGARAASGAEPLVKQPIYEPRRRPSETHSRLAAAGLIKVEPTNDRPQR